MRPQGKYCRERPSRAAVVGLLITPQMVQRVIGALLMAVTVLQLPASAGAADMSSLQVAAPSQRQGAAISGTPVTPARPAKLANQDQYRALAPGLLVRTRFRGGKGIEAIQLWDLMLGPGKTSGQVRLPATAILEVRSGTGSMSVSGKTEELRIGQFVTVQDQAELVLSNHDKDAPLIVRATILGPSQK